MGYRSEVCIVVSNKHLGTQKGNIYIPADHPLFQPCMFDFVKKGEEATLFYAESTKWYSCDKDIAVVEQFLHMDLDPEDYLFIRIGENMDDCETEGCFWDNEFGVQLSRSVTFNGKEDIP